MATIASGSTGTAGTVFIDDDGTYVRFYISCTNGSTNTYGNGWSSSFGGGTFNFPAGAGTILVATFLVTTTQTVSFTMNSTGTTGLGGPRTVSGVANRATVPTAPTISDPYSINHTEFGFNWTLGSNGGSAFTETQYQFSPIADFAGVGGFTVAVGTLSAAIAGLYPGTKYYYRVRSRNALGYGAWSAIKEVTTAPPVKVKVAGVYKDAIPYIKIGGIYKASVIYCKSADVYKMSTR